MAPIGVIKFIVLNTIISKKTAQKTAFVRRFFLAALVVAVPVASGVCSTTLESPRSVCVGKLQLSLPDAQRASWVQSFDHSHVERKTDARTLGEFWTVVEAREAELRSLPHDTEPGRLSRSERVDESAAILLYRGHKASRSAYKMQRFLWANGHGYYIFRSTGAMGPKFTNDLRPFTEIFSQIDIRPDSTPPSSDGFCIDGATILGNVGKITANVSVELHSPNPVRLWAGAVEDPSGRTRVPAADQEPKQRRKARNTVLAGQPSTASDPEFPREIKMLRNTKRNAGKVRGTEAIWREVLNNGAVTYGFRWHARVPGTSHDVWIGMDVDHTLTPNNLPSDKNELMALWEATLATVWVPGF